MTEGAFNSAFDQVSTKQVEQQQISSDKIASMKKKLADKIKAQQPKTNSLSEFDKLPVIQASKEKVDIVSTYLSKVDEFEKQQKQKEEEKKQEEDPQ